MLRVLRALGFSASALLMLGSLAARARAQDDSRAGVSLGAAAWLEIGGGECASRAGMVKCTDAGLQRTSLGGLTALDFDLLHWLRVGASAGLGFAESTATDASSGARSTSRHWLVPISVHSYWRVELGKHLTLWAGPELGIGVFVDSRVRAAAGADSGRSKSSGFLAGVALGLDARGKGRLRFALEIGQAVIARPEPAASVDGETLDLRALTRFALLLRYL